MTLLFLCFFVAKPLYLLSRPNSVIRPAITLIEILKRRRVRRLVPQKGTKSHKTDSWFRCRVEGVVLFVVILGALRSVSSGSGSIAPFKV